MRRHTRRSKKDPYFQITQRKLSPKLFTWELSEGTCFDHPYLWLRLNNRLSIAGIHYWENQDIFAFCGLFWTGGTGIVKREETGRETLLEAVEHIEKELGIKHHEQSI